MADVFISYKREEGHLTEWLAAELEARGYSVWWDTRLLGGDDIDEVIVSAINEAKAAIVIWTPASVRSRWVRSEARRADKQGKLVPVRVADLDPNDIPPPFDGYRTDLLEERERIFQAVHRLLNFKALTDDPATTLTSARGHGEVHTVRRGMLPRTGRSQRLRSIALIPGGALLAATPLFAYADFRSFEAETRGYLGVTFDDTRETVQYRLGYPDFVLEPAEDPEWAGLADNIYFTDGTKNPKNAMPDGKTIKDYKRWGFQGSGDLAEMTIEFGPEANQVARITCTALNTGSGKHCPPLFRVEVDDTDSSVLSKLGDPTREDIDNVTKIIRYDDVGVEITAARGRVYRISSFVPKGNSEAIRRRYIKSRLPISF